MAMLFTHPKKSLLPLLLLLFCISFTIVFLLLVSETTHTVAERGTSFRQNYSHVPPFTFLIKVLTFDRLYSLSRCLRSLSVAEYGVSGDRGRIHLHFYIDHFSLSRKNKTVEDNLKSVKEILDFVDSFEWRFGEKVVHYRTCNAGLQGQWLEAWWPSSDDEFAFVVEDDLEVSPLYYGFLERVIHSYYYDSSNFNPSIFGASLQRPRLVPGEHGNELYVDPKTTNLILYQLVGTWGQLLFPKPWKEFRLWYDEHKSTGKKPYLDGMVSNRWYKKMGERIWTPWFIKFVQSRGYFNIYSNFPNETALSVSHRDAGVNYRKTAGPDSQLLNRSFISSDFLKLQPLSNLKWYDFCFTEVVPGRVVRNLNELGTILPSVQRVKTIVLVSLFAADKMFIRNLLCHLEKLNTQNHIFIGPSSELFSDLSRRGHPVIDVDMFLEKLITRKNSYPNSVKEALGNAYVVKKCLELGYTTWIFPSNALLVDKDPLLDRITSAYDFYIGESSGVLIVRSSSVTQELWCNELLDSIVSSVTKYPSPKEGVAFIHLVKELVERKGKMINTVETMSIAENPHANSVNHSVAENTNGKPVVYWSPEVGSNIIRTKLEELKLWLIDDELSCKAVVCHNSLRQKKNKNSYSNILAMASQ